MNILAIPGSLRRASFNRLLLEAAAERAPHSMRVAVYDELASMPLFNEDLEHAGGAPLAPVARLRDAVAAAQGLLIATPEYNQSLPGVLKNALDWLSRPAPAEVLIGKRVAVIGASSGPWGTRLAQSALRQVLHATEAMLISHPPLYVRHAAQVFDASGRLSDPKVAEALERILASFAGASA
ncbi:MAG TPA: NADPH-dependent FMN reductase [Steroidobacteraceae bacterium]|nr:NADPH-dependent FMN reductase [Steroidobacteraceae bacterium]